MKFSENLRNLREVHGITQNNLAKYLEVSRATVAGYETKNHQPDYEKLEKIACYFGVSIDYLLTGEDTLKIEKRKSLPINEHVLDNKVVASYRTLSTESKQEVLKYLILLQLKEKYTK